jgi:CSLREA domain-containing protein
LPVLDFSVIINGPGADKLTVQRSNAGGTPLFRIFRITAGHTVRISGLTIANGSAQGLDPVTGSGGGILNQGTLFLDRCAITGNQAGIGGGLATENFLTMLNTTVANNTATSDGGGLAANFGKSIRIEGSTFSNNVSGERGGGIFYAGTISGLVTNTTISSNTAVEGGGIFALDDVDLRSVTITANHASTRGGGMALHFNSVRFSNTILAGNTSPLGPDGDSEAEFAFASFISDDYNLIGNTSGMRLTGIVTHNLHNVNPRLGPLASNGGPTQTHQLLDGSPAIDAGNAASLTDQRGFARRVDHPSAPNVIGSDLSDIGSFEARPFEVNTTSDADDGACTLPGAGNGCTLREAISAANNTTGTQTITFAPSLTAAGPAAITLLTALPDLTVDMNLTGPGAELLKIERSTAPGTPDFRVLRIMDGTVNISGVTIANGRIVGFGDTRGAGVFNAGQLTMSDCALYGNTVGTLGFNGLGGGIYNDGPSLTLINCKVGGVGPGQANFAGASGGGIFNGTGTLLVKGGSIGGNQGDGIAGNAATTLDGVSITDNTTASSGGAGIRFIGVTGKIINCLVANNTAGDFGGGFMNGAGSNTIVINSTFSGNTSISDGGGIANFNATLTLINVTVTNNHADSDDNGFGGENGGGVSPLGGTFAMHNSIVAGNFNRAGQNQTANDLSDGASAASGFNVIGVCDFCGLFNGFNNNQVGVSDAGLAPLANNGGPTLTHALLPASPALDRGNNALVEQPALNGPPFNDQRGAPFSRVVDGPDGDTTATVDVGAFEQQGSLARIQNTKTSEDVPLLIPFDVGDRGLINSITVSSSNDTLVPNDASHLTLAELGSTELLTINPAADRSGTTTITVNINRTGNSESHTFNVTVNPVNDAPTFTPGLSQNHDEDAGAFSFVWATNISAGPADESGQTLSFQITGNTNPGLFFSQPAITNGILQYVLRPDANGVAFITVVLKDNGGTANGGNDTSIAHTFSITVNAINDPPATRFPPFTQNVVENGSLTFSIAGGNRIQVLDIDLGNAPLQVTLNATNGLFTLNSTAGLSFSIGNGQANTTMTFTGSLASINAAFEGSRFTPNAGYDGPAQVQIVTNDGGASGFGGALTDTSTIFINVLNGGALQFQNSAHTVSEGMSKATITVNRVGGNAGAASVSYSTSGGTATGGGVCGAGIDYVDTTGTLSWTAGDATAKTFTITVCDDSLDEPDEVLNIALSAAGGSGQVGTPGTATLTLLNDDAPLLLTEENTDHAIALDSVFPTRDPFSLFTPHNFSDDQRRRVSLFVWRLGLQANDNASNVTVVAEDSAGMTYPLTVEFVGALPDLPGVTQLNVILPDNVIGAPRDLWLKVKVRGPGSNRAFIRIAAP